MLVLSRRENQTIAIEGGITVVVMRIKGNLVQLGIDAPRGVTVHRGEIQALIDATRAAEGTTNG